MRYLLKFFMLLCWTLGATGLQAAEPVSRDEARQIYSENCAVCHGDGGDGQSRARFGLNPQPRDFTTLAAVTELNRQRMIKSVTHGRDGTAMVGWHGRLSAPQIEGVVDYIRNTFMRQSTSGAALTVAGPHLVLGKAVYEEHCRVCHGDSGNGATWTNTVLSPPPRNFTSPQARRILSRQRMLTSVQFGREGTAMMSFAKRLSDEDIGAVVDYIRQVFMQGPVVADAGMNGQVPASHGANPAATHGHAPTSIGSAGMAPRMDASIQSPAQPSHEVDMKASFQMGLTGNFERGRDLYLRNCSGCHGVRGDGLGPRSNFIQPKPRNFLHLESRSMLNRPALFSAIVVGKPGTVMPAWGKVLSPQQVADVAEFVFQDFIHPDPDAINAHVEPYADKKKAR